MGKIGVQTARARVKAYCATKKMKQFDFGVMLNLTPTTFQRFMGAGGSTTGKGSLAYSAINKFFQAENRKIKKAQSEVVTATASTSNVAVIVCADNKVTEAST